ncbi:hypothetical protein Sste5346_004982 [Sporothrix stenoceras]|uniref:Uncharacterized protein n=1 Tax=Sporothrix stenoceras TaxID=5173 RepID=A0ABR3Z5H3_9PEZI
MDGPWGRGERVRDPYRPATPLDEAKVPSRRTTSSLNAVPAPKAPRAWEEIGNWRRSAAPVALSSSSSVKESISKDDSEEDPDKTPQASPHLSTSEAPKTGIYRLSGARSLSQDDSKKTPRSIPDAAFYEPPHATGKGKDRDLSASPIDPNRRQIINRTSQIMDHNRSHSNSLITHLFENRIAPKSCHLHNTPNEAHERDYVASLMDSELVPEPSGLFPYLSLHERHINVPIPSTKRFVGTYPTGDFDYSSRQAMERETMRIDSLIYDGVQRDFASRMAIGGYNKVMTEVLGFKECTKETVQEAQAHAKGLLRYQYAPGMPQPNWAHLAGDRELRLKADSIRVQMEILALETVNRCTLARTRVAVEAVKFASQNKLGHQLPIYQYLAAASTANANRENRKNASNAQYHLFKFEQLTGGSGNAKYNSRTVAMANFAMKRAELRELRKAVPANTTEYFDASSLIDFELDAMDRALPAYMTFSKWVRDVRDIFDDYEKTKAALSNAHPDH